MRPSRVAPLTTVSRMDRQETGGASPEALRSMQMRVAPVV